MLWASVFFLLCFLLPSRDFLFLRTSAWLATTRTTPRSRKKQWHDIGGCDDCMLMAAALLRLFSLPSSFLHTSFWHTLRSDRTSVLLFPLLPSLRCVFSFLSFFLAPSIPAHITDRPVHCMQMVPHCKEQYKHKHTYEYTTHRPQYVCHLNGPFFGAETDASFVSLEQYLKRRFYTSKFICLKYWFTKKRTAII